MIFHETEPRLVNIIHMAGNINKNEQKPEMRYLFNQI